MSNPQSSEAPIKIDELKVQAWPVTRPQHAPNNNKIHTEESTAKLAKSLAELGQIQPLIVDKDDVLIAGHGRLAAAKKLGWDKVKVIQLPVTAEVARKMRLADNLMSNQNLDHDAIRLELSELNLDLEGLGAIIEDDKFRNLMGNMNSETGNMTEEAFTDDVNASVERLGRENDEIMASVDDAETPLRKVFGFGTVSTRQARVLKGLVALAIEETGEEDPAAALVAWAEEQL